MLNLDVALSSFWQLARHWKNGQKAKLELNCEDENLYIQLSATLGKPDHVHFPAPFPPPQPASCKRKSPSQLRRQERRREEALAKADKAVPSTEASSQHSEKEVHEKAEAEAEVMEPFNCDQCGHTASCKEILMKHIAEKHKETETQDSEPISSNLSFQCDQCDFTGASDSSNTPE